MTTKGKVLAASCLMYFLFYMDRVNISSLAPIISKELQLNAFQLGIVFSAFAYPYAIFQIIGGYMGDRLGPKATLGLCGLLVGVATIWTGLAGGLVGLVCARTLLGAAEGPAFPTATRALAAVMPPAERGFAQGITHSSSRLGNAVTPAVVAALVAVSSWRGSFVTFGLCSLAWTLLWLAIYRTDKGAEQAALKPVSGEGEVPFLTVFKRVRPITLIDFCYGWVLWTYLNWTPLFLAHQYKLDLKHTAVFATGIFFAGVIGDTLGGLISDYLYKRYRSLGISRLGVIGAGFALSLVFIVPMTFISDLVTAAVLLSAAFFFLEFIVSPIWSLPMDLMPSRSGTASGIMNFGFGMAGIVSPLVIGGLVNWTGNWSLAFSTSIAIVVCGLVATLVVGSRMGFGKGAPAVVVGA
ncbi:MAG TPA: MFS transporter [Bradyrhizobium sp.]|uniref:MFS transporter n=1 Tax=Bradyrhizobium sp. TaxID=376 RepID=UPI002B5C1A1B|nr:MFS transporter [Bradyrhizobium sp.]HLZ05496.1 MFS transporter [Bradyrhizobium sp.]